MHFKLPSHQGIRTEPERLWIEYPDTEGNIPFISLIKVREEDNPNSLFIANWLNSSPRYYSEEEFFATIAEEGIELNQAEKMAAYTERALPLSGGRALYQEYGTRAGLEKNVFVPVNGKVIVVSFSSVFGQVDPRINDSLNDFLRVVGSLTTEFQ